MHALLREHWSPEQIAGRLRRVGSLSISHETIYTHVWRDKAAGGQLYRYLRGAQKLRRKRHNTYDSRGRLAGKRHISDWPAAVDRRARIGHWENGTECHAYPTVERATGVTFYFATPYHSWERGTNENLNGLLRQYLPKRTSFAGLTQRDCDAIAHQLNTRPRKRLGYRTPEECFYAR